MSDPDTRRCAACAAPIEPGASLCATCHSPQARWRRELVFWSSAIGFPSAAIAALFWAVTQAGELKTTFWPRDRVAILAFSSGGSTTVINSGEREVFISHLMWSGSHHDRVYYRVQEVFQAVPAGRTAVIAASFIGHFQPTSVVNWMAATGNAPDIVNWALNRARDARDKCFRVEAFSQDHPLKPREAYGFPVTATLKYYWPDDPKPREVQTEATAHLAMVSGPPCVGEEVTRGSPEGREVQLVLPGASGAGPF